MRSDLGGPPFQTFARISAAMPKPDPQRGSHWEDTAFFIGTLLLTAGGGFMIQAGMELPLAQGKLVWGAVGLVWGAVLIRVWIFREDRHRDENRQANRSRASKG